MDTKMIEMKAEARFPNSVTHRFGFVEGWKACVRLYFGDGPVAPKPAEDGEPTTAQIMDKLQDLHDRLDLFRNQANKQARTLHDVDRQLERMRDENAGRHNAITGAMVETQGIIQDVGQKVEAVLDQVTTVESHQAGDLTDIPVKRKACHEMLAKSFDDGFRFGEQFEKIRQRGRAE